MSIRNRVDSVASAGLGLVPAAGGPAPAHAAGTAVRTVAFSGTVRRALHSTRWAISARK